LLAVANAVSVNTDKHVADLLAACAISINTALLSEAIA
jgi:hypothetical protein